MGIEIKTSYISSPVLNNPKLLKIPKLKNKLDKDFSCKMKIELITAKIALIETEIIGATTLFNIEKISNAIWSKVNFLHRNNIATILLIDNSENDSPSILRDKSIAKIEKGSQNTKTYAIITILSKNMASNKGISSIQQEISEDLKRKNIIYGYKYRNKALKNLQKIIKTLRSNEKLVDKLNKASNPAYFIVSKVLKIKY